MIQIIVDVIRELRSAGFQLDDKFHICYTLPLTNSLLDKLKILDGYDFVDFNSKDWERTSQDGESIEVDFVIVSGCPLIIYSDIEEFYSSKKSITNELNLIEEFYIFECDVYFKNRTEGNDILEKITYTLKFSEFIFYLLGNKKNKNALNNKVYIKDKEVNINIGYGSYLNIENVDIKFVIDMDSKYSDAYRMEKEAILKSSIYHYINTDVSIDDIVEKWREIFELYTNRLFELIDCYSVEEKELKISTSKLDSIKVCNEILSDMIVKSLSIPAMIAGAIAINESVKNTFSLTITLIAVVFSICTTWISIRKQEELIPKISRNYKSLFDEKTFSEEINNKFYSGAEEIEENISKLDNVIALIKSGLVTALIIIIFLLVFSHIK